MKISYHITRGDFVEAQKLHCDKSPGAWIRVSRLVGRWLALMVLVTLLGWALVSRDRLLWLNLRPLFIFAVLWAIVFWLWRPFSWRRTYARDHRFEHQITADISEDGIHFDSAMANSNVKWALFLRLLESDQIFLLYQSRRLFNMFPKRAFAPGEADQFRELVTKHVPSK